MTDVVGGRAADREPSVIRTAGTIRLRVVGFGPTVEIGILDLDKRTAPVDVGRLVEGWRTGIASAGEIEIVEIKETRSMQIDADKVGLIEQATGYEGLTWWIVEVQNRPFP
jgi:hypothetical protein